MVTVQILSTEHGTFDRRFVTVSYNLYLLLETIKRRS